VSSREGIEAAKVKGTERRRKGNNMEGGKGGGKNKGEELPWELPW